MMLLTDTSGVFSRADVGRESLDLTWWAKSSRLRKLGAHFLTLRFCIRGLSLLLTPPGGQGALQEQVGSSKGLGIALRSELHIEFSEGLDQFSIETIG